MRSTDAAAIMSQVLGAALQPRGGHHPPGYQAGEHHDHQHRRVKVMTSARRALSDSFRNTQTAAAWYRPVPLPEQAQGKSAIPAPMLRRWPRVHELATGQPPFSEAACGLHVQDAAGCDERACIFHREADSLEP